MIQGEYNIELKFVDDRVYLNYWDSMHGNDVCCELREGKLLKFVYTPKEVEDSEVDGADIDVLAQKEITIERFVGLVKESIEHQTKQP